MAIFGSFIFFAIINWAIGKSFQILRLFDVSCALTITILGYLICSKSEIKGLAPFIGPLIFVISLVNVYLETYNFFDQTGAEFTKSAIKKKRDLTIHSAAMTLTCWLVLSQEYKITSVFYSVAFALHQFAIEVCICVLLTAPMAATIRVSFNYMQRSICFVLLGCGVVFL